MSTDIKKTKIIADDPLLKRNDLDYEGITIAQYDEDLKEFERLRMEGLRSL